MGLFDNADAISGVSRRSSRHHHHKDKDKRSRSRSRSRSRTRSVNITARSFFGLDNGSKRHHHSSSSHHDRSSRGANASFFSLPNVSSRSIFSTFSRGFGGGGAGGGSSYYRRSPRSSFLQRAYRKLKRLLRDLVYYAKKHPMRVFMLAIMPLITGGALTALLARFGLRLPASLERMVGLGARAMTGDSVGLVGEAMRMAAVAGGGAGGAARAVTSNLERGRRGNMQWERRSSERDYFSGGGDSYGFGGSSRRSDTGSGWGGSLAGITKIFS